MRIMEVLPQELWIMISGHLTLPDRCHLAQTCVHLYGVMAESISSLLKVEELVISGERDILSKEFLQRYASTQIRKIKIVIPKLTHKCVDFLRDAFDVCSSVEGLEIQTKKDWSFVDELNTIFASISIKEFHAKVMAPGIIIPQSVEKCTMPSSTFEKMFQLHEHRLQELEDAASTPDSEPRNGPPFLNDLRNLAIHFEDDQFKLTTPSIWTFISEIQSLEELAFNDRFSKYLADFRLARNTFGNVKTLRLNIDLDFEDTSITLRKFRCLEILYFNLSSSSLMYHERSLSNLFRLPSTLKELHVHGIVYGGDPGSISRFSPDRGIWTCLFRTCKEAPIEVITQNYTFLKENAPMAIAPSLKGLYRSLMEKVGCSTFKSLYFHIRFPHEWTYIQTHLQEFTHLEHLHLFVWLHNEYEVDNITVASPKITTSIKLLTVDDNHFHHDTSFKILSSFSNVGGYAINCSPESRFFALLAASGDWNQPCYSTLPWSFQFCVGDLPYNRLRDFAFIKKITLGSFPDLKVLRIAAPSLEVLIAEGGNFCMIASCLRFSNLRLAHFRDITSAITKEELDDIASNGEYHRGWPRHLESIVFTFRSLRGTTRPREIRIIRDEFRIKVLDSLGEMDWDRLARYSVILS